MEGRRIHGGVNNGKKNDLAAMHEEQTSSCVDSRKLSDPRFVESVVDLSAAAPHCQKSKCNARGPLGLSCQRQKLPNSVPPVAEPDWKLRGVDIGGGVNRPRDTFLVSAHEPEAPSSNGTKGSRVFAQLGP